jgi:hypothetical protein
MEERRKGEMGGGREEGREGGKEGRRKKASKMDAMTWLNLRNILLGMVVHAIIPAIWRMKQEELEFQDTWAT